MSICSTKLIEKIDGIAEDNRNGVFIRDNGKVSCRAPSAA
jgi:hypothetical protein